MDRSQAKIAVVIPAVRNIFPVDGGVGSKRSRYLASVVVHELAVQDGFSWVIPALLLPSQSCI